MFSYIYNVTETFSIRRLVHLRVLSPFSWAGGRGGDEARIVHIYNILGWYKFKAAVKVTG